MNMDACGGLRLFLWYNARRKAFCHIKETAMDEYKIIRAKREFRRFGFGIWDFYWHMVDRWNKLLDNLPPMKMDRRKRHIKAIAEMQNYMINLSDMINQTEKDHNAEIEKLKNELAKWTENRGRKPLLTESDCDEIKQRRADAESCRKLARDFGVSERTVRRVLKTH
jgi:hypothetical protein